MYDYTNEFLKFIGFESDIISSDKDKKDIKDLYTIYQEFNIEEYYYETSYPSELLEEAKDNFINAYVKIRDLKKRTYHILYALANLARVIDKLSLLDQNMLLISVETIFNFLDSALKIYPTSGAVFLLKGKISEFDVRYNGYTIPIYQFAIEFSSNKNDAYYAMGQYYERRQKDVTMAKKYYIKAIMENHFDYRTMYQIACIDMNEKNYIAAAERLNIISNILEKKKSEKSLHLPDYTILNKTYTLLFQLYNGVLDDSEKRDIYDERLKTLKTERQF